VRSSCARKAIRTTALGGVRRRARDRYDGRYDLKPIQRLPNVRCWRKLAESHTGFEDDVLEACRLAGDRDGPLGKVPVRQKAKRAHSAPPRGAQRPGAKARKTVPAGRKK
jgi:hypothetical protein